MAALDCIRYPLPATYCSKLEAWVAEADRDGLSLQRCSSHQAACSNPCSVIASYPCAIRTHQVNSHLNYSQACPKVHLYHITRHVHITRHAQMYIDTT